MDPICEMVFGYAVRSRRARCHRRGRPIPSPEFPRTYLLLSLGYVRRVSRLILPAARMFYAGWAMDGWRKPNYRHTQRASPIFLNQEYGASVGENQLRRDQSREPLFTDLSMPTRVNADPLKMIFFRFHPSPMCCQMSYLESIRHTLKDLIRIAPLVGNQWENIFGLFVWLHLCIPGSSRSSDHLFQSHCG